MPEEETTTALIARIREEFKGGLVPKCAVLHLCKRTEELLSVSLRMEAALHEALKIIEKNKLTAV